MRCIMDTPIGAAGGWRILVRRQGLAQLQVEGVIDVELDAATESGIGLLLLDVVLERADGVVRLDVAGVADGDAAAPDGGEAGVSLGFELLPIDAGEIARQR